MKFKNLLYLLLFMTLIACETGAEEVEKPNELKKQINEQFSFERRWSVNAFKSLPLGKINIASDQDSVFIFDSRGEIKAFSSNGKRIWNKKLDVDISTGITLGFNKLLLSSSNGEVFCLSKDSGETIWQYSTSGEVLSPPATNGDIVAIQNIDGRVTAVDLETGEFRWDYRSVIPNLTLRGTSEPSFYEGFLYIGFANGNLAKIEPRSGVTQWEIPITTSKETSEIGRIVDIDGNFVFSSGIAFVATFQGDVAALDTRSGRFIWKEKTSTANDLLSSRGKIILIDEKDQVLAYSQNSGKLEWFNKDFFLRELTSPNRLKSLVVYGDFQGFLHALDISQGEQVARKRVSRSKIISISTKDENVLTLDSKGKLSLFTLQ
ncbi:MAG: outer membrane protein assembly factor BamB [SAR86 cluster bacterium]|uniref:Outer membrane protein assembly factor BamB n=1 Tax=SAR86 cluster bacterium TaxID=2030880 RepID=A0A937LCE6_9GAMM|nr:outer membrane protein assembly factor BamB [SAR86 cluster bacterium]